MSDSQQFFVFHLDERPYALDLSVVQRVVRVVDITPLPKAPDTVLGIINVQGEIIPVFDVRKRFRLPSRETRPGDHMIIARTAKRTVVVVADEVKGVSEAAEAFDLGKVVPGMEYVEGVIKLEDGMVLIHDLDTFLSLEEEKVLEDALKGKR